MAAEGDEQAALELQGMAEDAPTIAPQWLWIWQAWNDLACSHPVVSGGMDAPITLPLPWATIEDYGMRLGLELDARIVLHRVLAALDVIEAKHRQAERKKHAEASA